jgi:hypothetical protein
MDASKTKKEASKRKHRVVATAGQLHIKKFPADLII